MPAELAVTVLTGPAAHDALHVRLYAGEILVFRGFEAGRRLQAVAERLVRAAFAPEDPQSAADALGVEAFTKRALGMRREAMRDADYAEAWRAALRAAGFDTERLFWDPPRLRAAPSGAGFTNRRLKALPPHRDTWGSNLAQQINWWGVVFPVTAGNTMALYLDWFDRPVANDSADWDLNELRRHRRADTADGYPLLPTAIDAPPAADAAPLLPEPGDVVAFSAAHLHASVPNETGVTRFSMELRTVDAEDLAAGRGAPHDDCATPHTAYEWFHRVTDGTPLAPPGGSVSRS